MSEACFHDSPLSSPHDDTPSSLVSEDSSDLLDLDEGDILADFSGHLLPGYSMYQDVLIKDASADTDYDDPVITHHGWSPDIHPSQEKSYHSLMGIGGPLNLPQGALDSSDCEPDDDPRSPFHSHWADCTNDLELDDAPDFDALHTDEQGMELASGSRHAYDLQFDYDSDDHGTTQPILFEHEPNSGALTFGKACTLQ